MRRHRKVYGLLRFYLMVDRGDGPRALGVRQYEAPARTLIGEAFRTGRAHRTRRWWLVEAETADMARRIIARGEGFRALHPTLTSWPEGINACDCGHPDYRPGDAVVPHLENCASYGRIVDNGGHDA